MRFGISRGLKEPEILYLVKSNLITYPELLETVQDMLHYVLDEVTLLLKIWVNSKVPKDTGALRQSLLTTLSTSSVQEGLLNLIIGTDLHYADKVAAMSTAKVRHWIDPEAVGNFWVELQLYVEEITMNILQRSIDEYFEGTGKLMKMVRSRA